MKTMSAFILGVCAASLMLTACSSSNLASLNKKHYTVSRTYAQAEPADPSLPAVAEGPAMNASPAWGTQMPAR